MRYIYNSANLEGAHVTFSETQAIFDGMRVGNVRAENIVKVNNLKRVWQFMIDTLDRSTDFDYMSRLNMIIGGDGSIYGVGEIRAYDIKILEPVGNHKSLLNMT